MSLKSACAVASLLFAALAMPAWAQQKKVILGVSGRPDQAPIQIALDRGYFKAEDLDVETVVAASGVQFVSSLGTNQIQVAYGSSNAGLFNALNRGIDIRIVADYAHLGPHDTTRALVVRADLMESGAVKTASNLKGRSVAIGPPGLGQAGDLLFDRVFSPLGIGRDDVDIKYINFPDMIPAFASKVIDSAFAVEPGVTQAVNDKVGRVLIAGGDAYPGGELAVVLYSAAFAADKDAATHFMMGYLRGVRDYYDAVFLGKDQEAVTALLVKALPLKDPSAWQKFRFYTDLNGALNVADLKDQARVDQKIGGVTAPVNVDHYVDTSFATAAVKTLGVR